MHAAFSAPSSSESFCTSLYEITCDARLLTSGPTVGTIMSADGEDREDDGGAGGAAEPELGVQLHHGSRRPADASVWPRVSAACRRLAVLAHISRSADCVLTRGAGGSKGAGLYTSLHQTWGRLLWPSRRSAQQGARGGPLHLATSNPALLLWPSRRVARGGTAGRHEGGRCTSLHQIWGRLCCSGCVAGVGHSMDAKGGPLHHATSNPALLLWPSRRVACLGGQGWPLHHATSNLGAAVLQRLRGRRGAQQGCQGWAATLRHIKPGAAAAQQVSVAVLLLQRADLCLRLHSLQAGGSEEPGQLVLHEQRAAGAVDAARAAPAVRLRGRGAACPAAHAVLAVPRAALACRVSALPQILCLAGLYCSCIDFPICAVLSAFPAGMSTPHKTSSRARPATWPTTFLHSLPRQGLGRAPDQGSPWRALGKHGRNRAPPGAL